MDLGGEQLGLGSQGAGPMPAPPPTDAAETVAARGKTHPGWRASLCSRRKQSGFLCRRLGLQMTAAYSTRVTAREAAGLGGPGWPELMVWPPG